VRLRGVGILEGIGAVLAICSIGGMANIGVAAFAYRSSDNWALAGLAGTLIGAVFNSAMASSLIWQRKPQRSRRAASLPVGELSGQAPAPEPNRGFLSRYSIGLRFAAGWFRPVDFGYATQTRFSSCRPPSISEIPRGTLWPPRSALNAKIE
jgi:hypothetical protein